MKIVFSSNVMHSADFEKLFKSSKKIPGQQVQKLHRLFVEGFERNDIIIHIISSPPVTPKNLNRRIVFVANRCNNKTKYHYLPVINIKGIKNIFTAFVSFLAHLKDLINSDAMFCDVLNISVSLGGIFAAKILNKPCIGLVTDLPELMVSGCSKTQARISHFIIDSCDMYVLAAEPLNQAINRSNKPYVVIEGISSTSHIYGNNRKKNGIRKCLYAGMIEARYGVKTMVNAFIAANIPNVELHLCGSGSYVKELRQVIKHHKSIVFHGTIWNEDVIKMEKESILLINPRPTHEEFVKYSFPSKNIEYMSSGTPILTTKLPSMPLDYYRYVYLFSGEDEESMKNSFVFTLNKSDDELIDKGKKAKAFIEKTRNSRIQASKVITLLERFYEE